MAQLRYALAALAVTTAEPADLLAHLNRLLYDSGRETTATAVVARYDVDDGMLVWAQAGHPAPLMHRAGRTTPLDRPPGPLLGAIREPTYERAKIGFRPGDVLVLYTDGLIEQPGRSVEAGVRQVSQALDDAIAGAGGQPLAALLSRLDRANANDDTCIVAARPVPLGTR
jgi:serine phosphatase RsbU (regulator of sigma subunit)